MPPLPAELLDAVLDHLDSTLDVRNSARVCRAWYARAAYRIYRSIIVDVGNGSLTSYHNDDTLSFSAAVFARLIEWDASVLALVRTLRYDFNSANHRLRRVSPRLARVPFPQKLQVTTLILDSLYHWDSNDKMLLLTTNFASITSLELVGTGYFENAEEFACAMAGFPLLRSLTLDTFFMDMMDIYRDDFTHLTPPRFAQTCDLVVNTPERATWRAILAWVLLDLPRIGIISLGDTWSIETLCKYLPSHPQLAPRIQEISQHYIYNWRDIWPVLDEELTHFPQLRALRLHTLSEKATATTGDLDEQDVGLFDKLVQVIKCQLDISPRLREVFLNIPTELFTASHAREAVARLDSELARLDALSQVKIQMSYYRYPDSRSRDDILIELYSQELPLLERTGRLRITIS